MSASNPFEGSNAGTKPGLEVWRIEKLKPVRVSESFGTFYRGDCYLVLHSYKKVATSSKLDADLFYWQGSAASQDERGASAFFAVQLDDFLGGTPIQHREVEGHESAQFLSLFPDGIQLLDGGVDSAFRHVDPDAYQPRLFHIKGKRGLRCVQVELSARQLCDGDVYILDTGKALYQWNGAQANRQEKFKGLQLLTKIKDVERGGKARAVFLESGAASADAEEFFRVLGGSQADVRSADSEGNDDDVARVAGSVGSLWRISDADGSIQMAQVASSPLQRSMLDDNDVFLLDGQGEVFVWIGRGASKTERAKAMEYGAQYLRDHGRPEWTALTRLPSGGETPVFKSFFKQFDQDYLPTQEPEYVAREKKLILDGLLAKQQEAAEKLIDAGAGSSSVQVWRIENLARVPVDPSLYGQFNSGDSYIVLFKYRNGNRDSYILYFWQGRESTTDEKAASALLSVELVKEQLSDLPGTQVRVVQNKEPVQFLALFKGRFVVFRANGAAGLFGHQELISTSGGVRLFHIRGSHAIDTRAVEVAAEAASLNSGDCFVLLTEAAANVWFGNGSNDDERRSAQELATRVLAGQRPVQVVTEGTEGEDFWSALGGKTEYASSKALQAAPIEPRLFVISGVTGDFRAEEIVAFSQDDLAQSNVYLLDCGTEVSVWVGAHARAADRDAALDMALRYVQNAPDGRDPNTPVFKVAAGAEPFTFTCHFRGWSNEKATDLSDPYQAKLAKLQGQASTVQPPAAAAPKMAQVAPTAATATSSPAVNSPQYSLSELKGSLPAGVIATQKETHLSDADFKTALGMDRDAFYKQAQWKRDDLKKKAGIF